MNKSQEEKDKYRKAKMDELIFVVKPIAYYLISTVALTYAVGLAIKGAKTLASVNYDFDNL